MRKSVGTLIAAATFLFATVAMAATVTYVTVLPTLAFGAPGYVANGQIVANVANDAGCTGGTFTVNATPVAGSGPSASTPPGTAVTTYIGFPAGAFLFNNAGWGDYTITTTTTACAVGVPPPPVVNIVSLAPPATIPTLTEWAMILLALLMAGSGAVLVRRRFA